MAQEVRKVEFNGNTKTIAEWSKETGISKEAIRHRLVRGHSVETALTKSYVKPISKNDVEMELNGMEKVKLPKALLDIMEKTPCTTKRYGYWFRTYFRNDFDKWFEETYNLKGTKDVPCFADKKRKVFA